MSANRHTGPTVSVIALVESARGSLLSFRTWIEWNYRQRPQATLDPKRIRRRLADTSNTGGMTNVSPSRAADP